MAPSQLTMSTYHTIYLIHPTNLITTTGVHSIHDLIWCVMSSLYMVFWMHRGSLLLSPPVVHTYQTYTIYCCIQCRYYSYLRYNLPLGVFTSTKDNVHKQKDSRHDCSYKHHRRIFEKKCSPYVNVYFDVCMYI